MHVFLMARGRASTTSSGCSEKSNTSGVLLELEVRERWVKVRETGLS